MSILGIIQLQYARSNKQLQGTSQITYVLYLLSLIIIPYCIYICSKISQGQNQGLGQGQVQGQVQGSFQGLGQGEVRVRVTDTYVTLPDPIVAYSLQAPIVVQVRFFCQKAARERIFLFSDGFCSQSNSSPNLQVPARYNEQKVYNGCLAATTKVILRHETR